MDDLLDSVSDTVSQMILYASTASEETQKLIDIGNGAKTLHNAIIFFVNLGTTIANNLGKLNREDLKLKVESVAKELSEVGSAVVKAGEILQKIPSDKDAKRTLLMEAKKIVTLLVSLVDLNDLFEVLRIVYEANLGLEDLTGFENLESFGPDFVEIMENVTSSNSEICRLLYRRAKILEAGKLAASFATVGDDLKLRTDEMIAHTKAYFQNPNDPKTLEKKRIPFKKLEKL